MNPLNRYQAVQSASQIKKANTKANTKGKTTNTQKNIVDIPSIIPLPVSSSSGNLNSNFIVL